MLYSQEGEGTSEYSDGGWTILLTVESSSPSLSDKFKWAPSAASLLSRPDSIGVEVAPWACRAEEYARNAKTPSARHRDADFPNSAYPRGRGPFALGTTLDIAGVLQSREAPYGQFDGAPARPLEALTLKSQSALSSPHDIEAILRPHRLSREAWE